MMLNPGNSNGNLGTCGRFGEMGTVYFMFYFSFWSTIQIIYACDCCPNLSSVKKEQRQLKTFRMFLGDLGTDHGWSCLTLSLVQFESKKDPVLLCLALELVMSGH